MLNQTIMGFRAGDPLPDFRDILPGAKTDSNGMLQDKPFGSCDSGPRTITDVQNVRIVNHRNAGAWTVRTHNWRYDSNAPGHGSVTNGVDINEQR